MTRREEGLVTSESLDPNLPTCGFIIRGPETAVSSQPLCPHRLGTQEERSRKTVYLCFTVVVVFFGFWFFFFLSFSPLL